jgi:hypothetical protein
MKYCIGCVHLDLTPRDPGRMGSTWTGVYGDEEAATFCKKDHWRVEMGTDATLEDFQRAMEKAETCPDFEERSAPDTGAEHGQ